VIYRRTVGLRKAFRSLPPEITRAARVRFALFSANWRHPSLCCHKLTAVFWHGHQVFDLYVTEKYRILFVIDRDIVVSFSIGTHGIVSK
jgi:hypothetical protein